MKRAIPLALCFLFLCGCGGDALPAETVSDTVVPAWSWTQEAYCITFGVPSDAQELPTGPAENCRRFVGEDGAYEIETRVLLASDERSAIRQLSGFDADDLDVVRLTRFSMPEYRFAWYRPVGDGGMVCRCDLFRDGEKCYAVTVSVREEAGREAHRLATEVFSTVGLFYDEGV